MKKTELIERAARRARTRYGVELDEALFDDLLKDGLIPNPERHRNEGQKPDYQYDYRAYRRVLQIARLRSEGIIDRDATRLFLFLKGYSLPVWDVREALLSVYVRHAKSLLAAIRSAYPDNKKPIPPKHLQSLRRAMGNLDPRFQSTGLILSDDLLVDALRAAKQDALRTHTSNIDPHEVPNLCSDQRQVRNFLLEHISGLLMLESGAQNRSTEIDSVEALIRRSDDQAYLAARELYRNSQRIGLLAAIEQLTPRASTNARENEALSVSDAASHHPKWASLLFVLYLSFVAKNT